MQIKFEGQERQIDSNTLINTLIHYNTIISEANREFGGGSKNVSLKINAIEKGSFLIDMSLQETVMGIFSSEGIAYLSGLVTIIGGVFSLYKSNKGNPAKTVDVNVNIKGSNNTIENTVINVYNTPVVREAISKSIETANEDSGVEGIVISGKGIEPIVFKKREFADLIYTDFDKEEDRVDEYDEIIEATLSITKLSFDRGGQWQFMYNGFKISTTMKNDALMKHIDEGARFAKGDSIKVKMKIIKKYNPKYNAYENMAYKIIEFLEHIIGNKPKQMKIFNE
ncbi:hypothetical protein EZS27_009383 [termite gut metagenome]|uniref:Uncharacterized protein n=1 Tax=termite gut metagenome TaxID=433724 RepID=A0A5J4SCA8_9ZZZZ